MLIKTWNNVVCGMPVLNNNHSKPKTHVWQSSLVLGYEELTGQPPATRSMEAIPNIHAIVQFDTVCRVDHVGGCSIMDPPADASFSQLTNFQV